MTGPGSVPSTDPREVDVLRNALAAIRYEASGLHPELPARTYIASLRRIGHLAEEAIRSADVIREAVSR